MKAKYQRTLIVKLPHEYAENIVTGRAEVALLRSCPPPYDLKGARVLIQDEQNERYIGEAVIAAADCCPVDSNMNGISYAFSYWKSTGMSQEEACDFMYETDIPAALTLACPLQYDTRISAQRINRSWALADLITEDMCSVAKKHTYKS